MVLLHFLSGGQLRDFLDTFRIENVVRVEQLETRLFQVVDGRIIQAIAVKIRSNDLQDFTLELFSLVIQLHKLKLLTDRFESLRELGIKQFTQSLQLASSFTADGLCHFAHLFLRFVDTNEEGNTNVSSDVVFANESFGAFSSNFETLEGEVHLFAVMHDGHHKDPVGCHDLHSAPAGPDNGFIGSHFFVEAGDQSKDANDQD